MKLRRPAAALAIAVACALAPSASIAANPTFGLPPVPIPADNPQTPEKIALGEKLFNEKRFSSTGDVACAKCHAPEKAFGDGPLKTSEGIRSLRGTRNAPTAANAAFFASQFWDGRSPSLEDQALHPFVNPIEMGLPNHDPILKIVNSDPAYVAAFSKVFGTSAGTVTMKEVTKAIASFERTLVFGDSPFDRWHFGGDKTALSASAQRGFKVFLEEGRCVSCHTIEQDHALFTDNRFHNVGVGVNKIQPEAPKLIQSFLSAKARGADVDKTVLSDPKVSELGRFAVTDALDDIGGFKTSTLRNVALTAPFMHDGSLATLRDVVDHYNNGGVTNKNDPVNDFLSGGIRPLNLTEEQIVDLVAFLESLTSSHFAAAQQAKTAAVKAGTAAACSVPSPKTARASPSSATQPLASPLPQRAAGIAGSTP